MTAPPDQSRSRHFKITRFITWRIAASALGAAGALLLFRKTVVAALIVAVTVITVFVFTFLGSHRNINELISPNGSHILTVYDSYGVLAFQGGLTVFNLRRKNERFHFMRCDYLTGERLERGNDVAIVDGNYYPYQIVWLDDRHLAINAEVSPNWPKMYDKRTEKWDGITVSYGIIDSIGNPQAAMLYWKR